MIVSFTLDTSKEVLEEIYIKGLFEDNFIEADPRSTNTVFELNLESCYNLLDANLMKIVVARDEYGEIQGYVIYTLMPQDLFARKPVASTICLYVTPEYRGGTTFSRMLKFAEKSAKMLGATCFHVALTPNTSSLERVGYHVDNIVYSKLLEA